MAMATAPNITDPSHASAEFVRRAVAGSFIFRFPEGDRQKRPQVALFRRSDRVRTYQGCWAPISGTVEETDASAVAAAWRELHEETGLTKASIRLFRQGKPYSFVDENARREWNIHPFAFVLEHNTKTPPFKLDWEHSGFEWFDPGDVNASDTFGGVPRLVDSLRRVYPEDELGSKAAQILNEGLRTLQENHTSGANLLAANALHYLREIAQTLATDNAEKFWSNLRMAAWHLWKNGREGTGAPIINVLITALEIVEGQLKLSGGLLSSDWMKKTVEELRIYGSSGDTVISKVTTNFRIFLESSLPNATTVTLMTMSNSTTVLVAIQNAISHQGFSNVKFDVRILESRPLFEGVSLASALLTWAQKQTPSIGRRLKVTVYPDAAAGVAAKGVHFFVVGVDSIFPDGSVSARVGNLPAVLASKHVTKSSVRVVVLADKYKVSPISGGHYREENDPWEVMGTWRREENGIQDDAKVLNVAMSMTAASQAPGRSGQDMGECDVVNVHFEAIPECLLDIFLFEDGVRKANDVQLLTVGISEKVERFFGSI